LILDEQQPPTIRFVHLSDRSHPHYLFCSPVMSCSMISSRGSGTGPRTRIWVQGTEQL